MGSDKPVRSAAVVARTETAGTIMVGPHTRGVAQCELDGFDRRCCMVSSLHPRNADAEGSTFRKTAAAARSVFRIRPEESTRETRVGPGKDAPRVERWETLFALVLRVLSKFPEAYAAVTAAMKETEASP